jgi:hypothetical protein
MKMHILIPTYGRAKRQITWQSLKGADPMWGGQLKLVVQKREAHMYHEYPCIVLDDHVRTLPDTRQWILENTDFPRTIQLDDDLVFSKRRLDDRTKFEPCTAAEIYGALEVMDSALKLYAHVGMSHREGANRVISDWIENSRMMRVLGYDMDLLRREGIRHNRLVDVEDFDVNLQLLTKGYENRIYNLFVHNQGGSATDGGCSDYRTLETHDRDVRKLAELHPGLVRVVQKETKGSWGGGIRTDCVISWKAALAQGKARDPT